MEAISDAAPSIRAIDIVKRFGPLVANDHVSLEARAGQVLAVVGENGAGKSTLMNILSGLLQPDHGEIEVRGQVVHFNSPRDAIQCGIGMVHQHFMLIPRLTVAENVVLGHEPSSVLFNREGARKIVADLSHDYGLKLDPGTRVEALSVGLQQRVEILKVLYWGSEILIFDEPTAVLTPQESEELFAVLRDLASQGRTIVFISHKLKEVMAISNRIIVMRLGHVVANLNTEETSPKEIASKMIGREYLDTGREYLPSVRKAPAHFGEPVLAVVNLEVKSDRGVAAVRGVNLEVKSGEVLGIAGVEGNGQTELIEALTGLRPVTGGTASVQGHAVLSKGGYPGGRRRSLDEVFGITTPVARVRATGVAYVPEDRRERGLVLSYSVAENLILGMQSNPRFSRSGVLNLGAVRTWARTLVSRFDVRPPRIEIPAGNLSGGNQQKVVIAREFSEDPVLLIASQPTRGLDIGAAQFVHERIVEKRDAGTAVLLVSAELEEILDLADRIAVIYEGEIMGVFRAGEVSEDQIGLLMTGGDVRTADQSIDLEAPALAQGQQ